MTLTNTGRIELVGSGNSGDAVVLRSNLDNAPTGTVIVDTAVVRINRQGRATASSFVNRGAFTVMTGAALRMEPGIQSGPVERSPSVFIDVVALTGQLLNP